MKILFSRQLAGLSLAAILSTMPSLSSAQGYGPLSPGDELRVSWRASTSFLTTSHLEFVSMDPSELVARHRGRLVVIDAAKIRSVKRRIGTKPASAPSMVIGSAAGFAAGFLAGALAAPPDGARSATSTGLSTGVLVGAPLGALIAWMASRSRGIYEDVPIRRIRPVATLTPSGRVGVSLTLAAR